MSANLWVDQRHGAHIFVGRGLEAWHRLGKVVQGCLTWRQAIVEAGLDWQVVKQQLYSMDGLPVDAWGIFRNTDMAFLGAVGDRYTPIQNETCFEFVDALIGIDGAHYDSAGALGNGEVVWCSAHLPSAGFEVVPGDRHDSYLLFKTSHDGSLAAVCLETLVRVVCQNTLNQALAGNGHRIVIRHTKSSADKLEQAKRLVVAGKQTAQALHDRMAYLVDRQVTRRSLETILKELFPSEQGGDISTKTKNNIEDILKLFEWNDGGMFPSTKGSAYSLLNSITEYTDKIRSSKGDRRAESALFGSGDKFKTKAFDVITAQAANMPYKGQPVAVALMDRPESSQAAEPIRKPFMSSIAWPKSLM